MQSVRKNAVRPVDPWMTPNQAAVALGISRPTVLAWALKGELETQTVAGRTFISRASVERAKKATAAT